jgi:hypothetical protein
VKKEKFHEVKELKMQKKALVLVGFIILPVLVFAQYTGGYYDGYGMGGVNATTYQRFLSRMVFIRMRLIPLFMERLR